MIRPHGSTQRCSNSSSNAPAPACHSDSPAGLVTFFFADWDGLLTPSAARTRLIARLFSPDPTVIRVGATLLLMAAAFQLFDGLQTVATGALRGAGDTRTPMLANFLAYWLIGLPLGYLLCFRFGWGAVGVWIGLCIGLVIIGSALLVAWHRRVLA